MCACATRISAGLQLFFREAVHAVLCRWLAGWVFQGRLQYVSMIVCYPPSWEPVELKLHCSWGACCLPVPCRATACARFGQGVCHTPCTLVAGVSLSDEAAVMRLCPLRKQHRVTLCSPLACLAPAHTMLGDCSAGVPQQAAWLLLMLSSAVAVM